MRMLVNELKRTLIGTLLLSFLLCGIYPMLVWSFGQLFFPEKANGSLITRGGKVIGSKWIAQPFHSDRYFHPRPSAIDFGIAGANSGGSNLGPLSKKLLDLASNRIKRYREINNIPFSSPIPTEAVTSSGSGLDPHISRDNAILQAGRVAQARGVSKGAVMRKIDHCMEKRQIFVLGEERVNVLLLNLELDAGKWYNNQ